MRTIGVPLARCDLIGWQNAITLARQLLSDTGSYTFKAKHPELGQFATTLQTNAMLADIYDLIAAFATMYKAVHSKSRPHDPQRYPRPWIEDSEKIGKDPIPVRDFDAWYYGGE